MSDIWAITTFFNPARYVRRRANFSVFKAQLNVPLLAVELSFDGTFELQASDCDILVQVTGSSCLWQKERLLNVAIDALPSNVEHVAWIDCDLIFADPNWPSKAVNALREARLVQLFSALHDLPRDIADPSQRPTSEGPFGVPLVAAIEASNDIEQHLRPSSSVGMRKSGSGFAWAAPTDLMRKFRFYDAMVIGNGDRAMACAAYGRFDYAIEMFRLNESRQRHYLEWARPFHTAVGGRIASLDGDLYHLWHGDVQDRQYVSRHAALEPFNFNPYVDLVTNDSGAWEWNNRPDLQDFALSYFQSRNEDGR